MVLDDRNHIWNRRLVAAFGLLALGLSGCGSSSPAGKHPGAAPCAPQTVSASGPTLLMSAMLLSAVVQVNGPGSAHPKCVGLSPRSTVALHIGDSAEFEANNVPQLSPAGSGVVIVSTRPGPTSSGPGDIAGLRTAHVIVRLTAAQPGSVTARWIDCSGTGC
jgi:hypothetical protein